MNNDSTFIYVLGKPLLTIVYTKCIYQISNGFLIVLKLKKMSTVSMTISNVRGQINVIFKYGGRVKFIYY